MDCWNLYYLTDLSVLVLLNIFVTKLVCIKLYVVYISNNRWYTHGVCTDGIHIEYVLMVNAQSMYGWYTNIECTDGIHI